MKPLTDSNLVFRALIILGLVAFGVYLAADRGLLMLALNSDRSYISYVIFGIYLLASAHWLWLTYALGRERTRFIVLETELSNNELSASADDASMIGQFIANWRARSRDSDASGLLTAFGDELVNRHALGHFTSDALLKLGLLGTVVGFILMLLPVGEIEEFDPTIMQQLLSAMSGGMAVALYTTLAGLVTSTLLKFQYHILDASAADLATRLSVLLHITRDAS
jgi:hypothetical protein